MGLDPNSLPDSVINKIADQKMRPKGRLTAEEALRQEELRTERDHQNVFRNYLNLALARNELIYEQDDNRKPTTNVPGFPDFRIYVFGGVTLFVEFKMIKTGRLSHDQEMVKGVLESFQFKYFLVHSDKEAIEAVSKEVRYSITRRNRAIAALRQKQAMDDEAYREKMRRMGSAGGRGRDQKNPLEASDLS